MDLEPNLTPYMALNSKMDQDPNVRAETVKCLEENVRDLHDLRLSNGFLDGHH